MTKFEAIYDEQWMEIAKLRNRTVHTYSEPLADEIYAQLPKTLTTFKKLALESIKPYG